jgi:quercetin dioxygenase-like cupin family protein
MSTEAVSTARGPGASPGHRDALWFVGTLLTVKVGAARTGGRYALFEQVCPPGTTTPPHVHRDEDEWFYVLDGALHLQVGREEHRLTAGGFGWGPKGVPHAIRGVGPEGARLLVGSEPGGFEGFAREVGRPAEAPTPPPGPPEPDEIARVMAAAPRHGIEILGPPGAPVPV